MPHATGRTLFVHIGTHKTGTTSIQAFLAKHRARLADGGVFVPRTGTLGRMSGHHNLAWELRCDERHDPAQGLLSDLVAELVNSRQSRAVISSEDFEYCFQYPDRIRDFEETVGRAGWSVNYIVIFREQSEYAKSLHAELRKHGLEMRFGLFVAHIVCSGRFVMRRDWCFWFDYLAFLVRWRRATASPTRVYRFVGRSAGGMIPTFLDAIGVQCPELSAAAAAADVLNSSQARHGGLRARLATVVLRARFARSNARLLQAHGIDLAAARPDRRQLASSRHGPGSCERRPARGAHSLRRGEGA